MFENFVAYLLTYDWLGDARGIVQSKWPNLNRPDKNFTIPLLTQLITVFTKFFCVGETQGKNLL